MSKRKPQPPKVMQHRTVEIRAEEDADGVITGYAAHFGSIDSYGTFMVKGAFAQTVQQRGSRIPVLWNHWSDTPIGRPTELREDDKGLYFSAEIVEETNAGAEVMALLRKKVPLGMSFGFETLKSRGIEEADKVDWSQSPEFFKDPANRDQVRAIEEVRLWEISVVTFPANEMATIDSYRAVEQIGALSTLLEDLRAGRVSQGDSRWSLLQEVAAFTEDQPEPEPEQPTPLVDPNARRKQLDRQVQIALADARRMGLIEWSQTHV